jgi:hypothetical protein
LRALKNVQFCSWSRKTKILPTRIPMVFRGLKFESDAEIGQKRLFFKSLSVLLTLFRKINQSCQEKRIFKTKTPIRPEQMRTEIKGLILSGQNGPGALSTKTERGEG